MKSKQTPSRRSSPQGKKADLTTGNVSGIGNVIGHNSQSHVRIEVNHPAEKLTSPSERPTGKNSLLWLRLAAFLVALAGILGALGLFIRYSGTGDVWMLVQLALMALLAALGVSGVIRPQALVDLFLHLFGKKK